MPKINFKLVILETPFKGKSASDRKQNIKYARLCVRDCLNRGEAPYASHLLYTTGVLNENDKKERRFGINAGFAWKRKAHMTVVYTDRGISKGMQQGIDYAKKIGQKVEYRLLRMDSNHN